MQALDIHMYMVAELAEAYWREQFSAESYYVPGRGYGQYAPAYQLGWDSAMKYPDADYEDMYNQIEERWLTVRGSSLLPWTEVAPATRAAWVHARMQLQNLLETRAAEPCTVSIAHQLQSLQQGCQALALELQAAHAVTMGEFARQVLDRHALKLMEFVAECTAHIHYALGSVDDAAPAQIKLRQRWFLWRTKRSGQDVIQVFERCVHKEQDLMKKYEALLQLPTPYPLGTMLKAHHKWLQVNCDKLDWVRHNWALS